MDHEIHDALKKLENLVDARAHAVELDLHNRIRAIEFRIAEYESDLLALTLRVIALEGQSLDPA